jgi:hypothetical protein
LQIIAVKYASFRQGLFVGEKKSEEAFAEMTRHILASVGDIFALRFRRCACVCVCVCVCVCIYIYIHTHIASVGDIFASRFRRLILKLTECSSEEGSEEEDAWSGKEGEEEEEANEGEGRERGGDMQTPYVKEYKAGAKLAKTMTVSAYEMMQEWLGTRREREREEERGREQEREREREREREKEREREREREREVQELREALARKEGDREAGGGGGGGGGGRGGGFVCQECASISAGA